MVTGVSLLPKLHASPWVKAGHWEVVVDDDGVTAAEVECGV